MPFYVTSSLSFTITSSTNNTPFNLNIAQLTKSHLQKNIWYIPLINYYPS